MGSKHSEYVHTSVWIISRLRHEASQRAWEARTRLAELGAAFLAPSGILDEPIVWQPPLSLAPGNLDSIASVPDHTTEALWVAAAEGLSMRTVAHDLDLTPTQAALILDLNRPPGARLSDLRNGRKLAEWQHDYRRQKGPNKQELTRIADALVGTLASASASAGSVVVPDAIDDEDIRRLAEAVETATRGGARIVVRSAVPLAAELAGVASESLLAVPLEVAPGPTLLVCGQHTSGATAQLESVVCTWGDPVVVETARALSDAPAAGREVAKLTCTRSRG